MSETPPPDDTVGVRQTFGAPENDAQKLLDNFCWPVIGIRLALPQFDLGTLMVRMSGLFGRCVALAFSQGDLSSIFQLRAECLKAFKEGLGSVKPQTAHVPDIPQFDASKIIKPN